MSTVIRGKKRFAEVVRADIGCRGDCRLRYAGVQGNFGLFAQASCLDHGPRPPEAAVPLLDSDRTRSPRG